MGLKPAKRDGWPQFLVVAVAGGGVIYLASKLSMDTIPKTAAMAIVGIVVVVAYEYFVGWG